MSTYPTFKDKYGQSQPQVGSTIVTDPQGMDITEPPQAPEPNPWAAVAQAVKEPIADYTKMPWDYSESSTTSN